MRSCDLATPHLTATAAAPPLATAVQPTRHHHAATPTRICDPFSSPSRTDGVQGAAGSPPLCVRGVPGEIEADPLGATRGVDGDAREELEGEGGADSRRLSVVVAVRAGVEGGASGGGGGARPCFEIQEGEVCEDVQSTSRSRTCESSEADPLRGHGGGAGDDAAFPILAVGGFHPLGKKGGEVGRSCTQGTVGVHRGADANERPTVPRAGGSSALPVAGASKGLKPSIGAEWEDDGLRKTGGRFWALQCLDDGDDSVSDEESDQEICNPYLATIGDALLRAQKQKVRKRPQNQKARMGAVASCLRKKIAQAPAPFAGPEFRYVYTEPGRKSDAAPFTCDQPVIEQGPWFQIVGGKPVCVRTGDEPLWEHTGHVGRARRPAACWLAGAPLATRSPARRDGDYGDEICLRGNFFVSIRTLGRVGPGEGRLGHGEEKHRMVLGGSNARRPSLLSRPNPSSHLDSVVSHVWCHSSAVARGQSSSGAIMGDRFGPGCRGGGRGDGGGGDWRGNQGYDRGYGQFDQGLPFHPRLPSRNYQGNNYQYQRRENGYGDWRSDEGGRGTSQYPRRPPTQNNNFAQPAAKYQQKT